VTGRAASREPRGELLGVGRAFVDGHLVDGDVAMSDGLIVAVGLPGPDDGIAAPGLVDLQVNGYAGIDVLTASVDELVEMGRALELDGVFGYQPTIISSEPARSLAAAARIAEAADRISRQNPGGPRSGGAEIIGIHIEGPFLSPRRAGTHPPERLLAPDPGLLASLVAAGPVRMLTLAPELDGALEMIRWAVGHGIVVALGHTACDATGARAGVGAGARAVTHLYNGMEPMSARACGLAGVALDEPDLAVGLIADGVHVVPEMLRLAFRAAPGRCFLVSDAIAPSGGTGSRMAIGEVEVTVVDGVARRADLTIAGSVAPLKRGLAHLAEIGISPEVAVAAATECPARLVGRRDLGTLAVGRPADVVVLDDSLRLQRVFRAGRELPV
jgi:N-acetylglucosamine-6-phosphate deacetylase